MKKYEKILLAVELDPAVDDSPVVRAQELAAEYQAKLYIVHSIEHLSSYGAAYGVAAGADIEEMLLESADQSMDKLSKRLKIPREHCFVKIGPAKNIILEQADELGADLIVMGSHGRHGIRLLLGSTANAILHNAKCDVLAVRLQE